MDLYDAQHLVPSIPISPGGQERHFLPIVRYYFSCVDLYLTLLDFHSCQTLLLLHLLSVTCHLQ